MLQNNAEMEFGKMLKRLKLTTVHVNSRFEWSKKMSFVDVRKWKKTLFTDEKRFCLDSLDGNACYWCDERLDSPIFSTRQRGEGGLMT